MGKGTRTRKWGFERVDLEQTLLFLLLLAIHVVRAAVCPQAAPLELLQRHVVDVLPLLLLALELAPLVLLLEKYIYIAFKKNKLLLLLI